MSKKLQLIREGKIGNVRVIDCATQYGGYKYRQYSYEMPAPRGSCADPPLLPRGGCHT